MLYHCLDDYKAMFALRNLHSSASVVTLAKGFKDPSPLFRHEIAFVFGQMQHFESVPYLIAVLEDLAEVGVVRRLISSPIH
jgi:deoxyhypusine monooxygenase